MPRVNLQNQWVQCGQHRHDGLCDPRNIPTRNSNQPPPEANRGQGVPSDRRSRGECNGTTRSASALHKMESTMMITDEQQQQDDQPDGVLVLGEDFQPPAVVNVDVSEDLLATHISPD